MKIILIDDEPLILEELSYLCEKHKDIEICGKFVNPKQALQYVAGHPVDFAFCDIRMPGITGLELLDQMHKEKPDLQAAFVTAYDQYAFDAYQLDACDYLLKPFGQEEVDRALDKARRLVRTEQKDEMQLEIHTFGRFDLFLNGHAIDFSSRKAKDHGLLWMLHSERGRMYLETKGVSCDYYELMEGQIHAAEKFSDEFMAQYSWSEAFLPVLERQAGIVMSNYSN